ncbi:MAG: lactate utilization protein C [Alphaproteobacteria bacterium]|nr:lactate utilization protein C [Alphaproteobacteria bacterium]
MTAREDVLGAIRQSLGRKPSGDALREIRGRIARHEANLTPSRAADPARRLAVFVERAERLGITVERVADGAEVPARVAAFLARHNLPARVKMSPDAALDVYPWAGSLIEIARGPAEIVDQVGVTPVFTAIAETGTMVTLSGADRPATLNFVPDNHVAVLKRSQIVGTMEETWARLRAAAGEGTMPRAVNMISGASRTADIDSKIVMGAHGPRRLHILLVEDEPGPA